MRHCAWLAATSRTVALLITLIVSASCRDRSEIVVFHAASLANAMVELQREFAQRNPNERLRIEASGSQVACRKVSELNMRADVVASADAAVIDQILVPAHATYNILFATNELVLAHRDHSRYTEEVTTDNWFEILLRPGVQLGLVDPDLAPIGYRTLQAWQLAEREIRDARVNDLAARLRAKVAPEHVASDENDLLALLSTRAIDYAMIYRSTAEDHHLKTTLLPDAYNLGRAELAKTYARASVLVRMKHGEQKVAMPGAPVLYSLTIPRTAKNPQGAERLVALLLSESGRRILVRAGFRPLVPARYSQDGLLPPMLRPLVVSAKLLPPETLLQ